MPTHATPRQGADAATAAADSDSVEPSPQGASGPSHTEVGPGPASAGPTPCAADSHALRTSHIASVPADALAPSPSGPAAVALGLEPALTPAFLPGSGTAADSSRGRAREAPHVLVVEDEPTMRSFLRECFERRGYTVSTAASGEQALASLQKYDFEVVVTDYRLGEVSGLDVARAVKAQDPDTIVIMVTAYADEKVADQAMQAGVTDYILKPFNANQLYFVIERSLRYRRLQREHRNFKHLLDTGTSFGTLIGISRPMRELYDLIERVAGSEATVLITGESGTGKELIAHEIHRRSRRKDGPFFAFNCAALPESLLESELFGYEPGAFTGADRRKLGLIERARAGTLFLDEIAEMSPAMQAKLLRTLQEKEFTRLGGGEVVKVDIRLVAATNRDLQEEVFKKGTFRKDLYYRLNVVPIKVPPLRDRREDVPLLASHFLELYARKNARNVREISVDAMVLLCHYDWPGNVRELENLVERAVTLSQGQVICADELPEELRKPARTGGAALDAMAQLTLRDAKQAFEKRYLEALLRRVGGNVSEAARSAGVDRPYFYKKIKRYRIEPSDYRPG